MQVEFINLSQSLREDVNEALPYIYIPTMII